MDCSAPVIWWCRRDLRVDDNPSLLAALQSSPNLIPLFIWAPEEEGQFQPGRFSRWWTKQSVALFQRLLGRLGSRLIIRRCSDTAQCITQVVAETGAKAVYFNHLYDPISLVRDHEVKTALTKLGVECRSFNSDLLYEPWELLDSAGEPFTSFEAFWNRTLAMPYPPPFPLPAPHQLPPVSLNLDSTPLEKVDWFQTPEQEASCDQLRFKWKPGVEGAVEKLESFLTNRLTSFEADRAKVDRDSTSQLSPWIHIGTISVRYIFYRVCQQQAEWAAAASSPLVPPQALPSITNSCKDFLQQMGYREYSRYLSFHFPFITERALLAHLRACPWRLDQAAFKAWRQGQTGYPLVDAAMRQLSSTGWCHNRMRVVAASFMVKNLLLPWQWGLKHYWDAQLDADLECDALGWQYVSGGMADAHPFDHIIDLEKEAQRFDADGEYVRRWLPVLSRMPTQHIHAPWRAPHAVLAAADVELGFDYPERVVTAEVSLHPVVQLPA
ncbi:DNA photolyase, FAD-binding/Cryptochrome [Haematococcus lacustris]